MGSRDAREAQSYSSLLDTKAKKVKERCCHACGKTFLPRGPSRSASSRIYCYDPECEEQREAAQAAKRKQRRSSRAVLLRERPYVKRETDSTAAKNLVRVGQVWKIVNAKGTVRDVEVLAFSKMTDGRDAVVVKTIQHSETASAVGKNSRIQLATFSDTSMCYLVKDVS